MPSDPRDTRPICIDLFAGAGGLSVGMEQAGFDVVASLEYDPIHCAVHEHNFPRTEVLCADASKVEPGRLLEAAADGWRRHGRTGAWDGEIDAIVGGPPCQGFSPIGKRLEDDPRNRLVFDFYRLVAALRPRYFVMENVPGMASKANGGLLAQLVAELEGAGYTVAQPAILNASSFGVPQDRRRLFLFGVREGETPAVPPDAITHAVAKRPDVVSARAASNGKVFGPTVWDAIGDLPDLDDFDQLWHSDEVRLTAKQAAKQERLMSDYARRLHVEDADPDDLSHPRAWDARLLTSSTRTRHTQLSIDRFTATAPGEVEPISRFLRLHPAGLCNTLRAGTGSERGAYTSPRPIHPFLPRVLSVREAARLHSFPDWFRLHRTKWHGFRQIGNAVCPLVGRAVGAQLVAALGAEPSKPTERLEYGTSDLLSLSMDDAAARFGAARDAIPAKRRRTPVVA